MSDRAVPAVLACDRRLPSDGSGRGALKRGIVGGRRYEVKSAGWMREHIRANGRWEQRRWAPQQEAL